MNEAGDQDAIAARDVTGAPTGPQRVTQPGAGGETIMFLEPPLARAPLIETLDYRPGAWVALLFLALPIASALALAALAPGMGVPVWLPLLLLLWAPALLAGWWALGGVRLTRETIAFGRPLRPWRVVPLDAITRLERHGPRITLVTSAGGRLSFMPILLGQGAHLRRRLLLSLPAGALDRAMSAEAQRLLEGRRISFGAQGAQGGVMSAADALILRTRGWPVWLAGGVALAGALGAAGLLIWAPMWAWLAVALAPLALLALAAGLWLAQEIFVSDRGVITRYRLTGLTGSVAWDDVRAIRRAPGEVALVLRGRRPLVCAGPALLAPQAARQLREAVSRFAIERGAPVTGRPWR